VSSYWPKPIYLDCENGRGSLADRNMPYVEIKNSKDMLDALEYLKSLERTPKAQRQFQTVVVDTADSFQRVVKDEWVQQTKAQSFTGYDAWGYLDTKMQLLFTRLLNLDYNVIVLVHYKDKEHKDGDNTREFALQLQGRSRTRSSTTSAWSAGSAPTGLPARRAAVQKRGLTFQPTPDKPFLKDRFNVTPKWLEINFSDADYQQLFEAFFNRPSSRARSWGRSPTPRMSWGRSPTGPRAVIEDNTADTPAPQEAPQPTPVSKPSAPRGPSACADCGKDLGEEWNDPSKRDYIRLSFVKHRKYLCTGCLNKA
jgi:hypothetical protein